MLADLLIGAGCVAEVTGAWVGNVSGGMGHNYRRAAETGERLIEGLRRALEGSEFVVEVRGKVVDPGAGLGGVWAKNPVNAVVKLGFSWASVPCAFKLARPSRSSMP